jgi:hypothetical protein
MTTISRKEVLNLYCRFIKIKTKDDICWFFEGKTNIEMGCKIPRLYKLMTRWREFAKKGAIVVKKDDNGSVKSFDGKEWHYLVLKKKSWSTNYEANKHELDPLGHFLFDLEIWGEMLFFKHKSNRDKVQKYLMRRLEK